MPSDPPDKDDLDRTASTDIPASDAPSGPARARGPLLLGRNGAPESLWIRVGPGGADSTRSAGDRAAVSATVSDIESELDALGLEVVALAPDATGRERSLQKVVDRYERILTARERARRDGRDAHRHATETAGLLGSVRARIHAVLEAAER